MTEATPRPWRVIGKDDLMLKGHVCGTGDDQDGNSYFVQGDDYPQGTQTAKADAELIVQAVNAHDSLMAALRAVEWIGEGGSCPRCFRYMSNRHLPACQLAAALTKGEATV